MINRREGGKGAKVRREQILRMQVLMELEHNTCQPCKTIVLFHKVTFSHIKGNDYQGRNALICKQMKN